MNLPFRALILFAWLLLFYTMQFEARPVKRPRSFQPIANDSITRPVLLETQGQLLGQLYDARTDTFIRLNLFKDDLPSEYISCVDIPHTEHDIRVSNSNNMDNNELIDVNGSLELSIALGLFKLRGTGSFSKNKENTVHSKRGQIVFKKITRRCWINFCKPGINEYLNTMDMEAGLPGTHILSQITYGTSIRVFYENEVAVNKDMISATGSLSASLEKMSSLVSGSVNGQANYSTAKENNNNENFHFKIDGNLKTTEGLPSNLKLSEEFFANISAYIIEGETKVSQEYVLTSMEWQSGYCITTEFLHEQNILYQVDSDLETRLIKLITKMNQDERRFKSKFSVYENFEECMSPAEVKIISDSIEVYTNEMMQIKLKLQGAVLNKRSGISDNTELFELYRNATSSLGLINRYANELKNNDVRLKSLDTLQQLWNAGIQCLPTWSSFSSIFGKNVGKSILVFFGFSEHNGSKFSDIELNKWVSDLSTLTEQSKENNSTVAYAVECNLNPDHCKIAMPQRSAVYWYDSRGKLQSTDFTSTVSYEEENFLKPFSSNGLVGLVSRDNNFINNFNNDIISLQQRVRTIESDFSPLFYNQTGATIYDLTMKIAYLFKQHNFQVKGLKNSPVF